jgi:hypothetical protein
MIDYIKGDLFQHLENKQFPILIPHCCNDSGFWAAGFVKAISKFSCIPENEYYRWHENGQITRFNKVRQFCLGQVDYVQVQKSPFIFVANMIGQQGTVSNNNHKPIKYLSLAQCMDDVAHTIKGLNNYFRNKYPDNFSPIQIFSPKFGSGLAQGKWEVIEELINEIWIDRGIPVRVFVI